jgi:hypothetical protein
MDADEIVVHRESINRASAQPALHLGNIGGTLLLGAEETQIVAARLQDRDVARGAPGRGYRRRRYW